MTARIEADYLVDTAYDPARALEAMAVEQCDGTLLPVPGETPQPKRRSAARVERFEILGEVDRPNLPGAGSGKGRRMRAVATLSWPLDSIGPSLPNLLATIADNLFEAARGSPALAAALGSAP